MKKIIFAISVVFAFVACTENPVKGVDSVKAVDSVEVDSIEVVDSVVVDSTVVE